MKGGEVLILKPSLQKGLEGGAMPVGKSSRLFFFKEVFQGLKCELSGNPVLLVVTRQE